MRMSDCGQNLYLTMKFMNVIVLMQVQGLFYLDILNSSSCVFASANGHLYTWGKGFDNTPDVHCPQCLPSSSQFSKVALGWNHALLLTGIFMFLHSFLELFLTISQFLVPLLEQLLTVKMLHHTMVAITGSGEVYMLGGSNHGVLSDPQKMSLSNRLSGIAADTKIVN